MQIKKGYIVKIDSGPCELRADVGAFWESLRQLRLSWTYAYLRADFEFLVFQPPPLKSWDYRHSAHSWLHHFRVCSLALHSTVVYLSPFIRLWYSLSAHSVPDNCYFTLCLYYFWLCDRHFSIISLRFVYNIPDTRISLTMTKTIYRERVYSGLRFVLVVLLVVVCSCQLDTSSGPLGRGTSFKNVRHQIACGQVCGHIPD